MRSNLYVSLALVTSVALTSCSKMGDLSADNFTVTPSPLEAVGGQVPATINGRFPEKYMKKKAVVTVTPVLRYAGGEAKGQSATFQGEKVEGNDQAISYKVGGSYTMKNTFKYVPEMIKSELYLTFDARKGKKAIKLNDVKIADGVLSTSALLAYTLNTANPATAPDAYQHVIEQRQQANIKFLIQQANIRTSELKSTSIQDFIKTLRDINADQERKALSNIEVSAYASPDGGFKLNEKLAAQREKNSSQYVNSELKKIKMDASVETKYTAQDWEGFQELVSASNIQDKELILRVLSMYKEPEEREKQIRNISAAFSELADEILPQLRRARLTINYELIGRSDDEIQEQFKSDASQLSVEELLYAATLTENANEQKAIFQKTTQVYPNDYRAFNNLGELAYRSGDLAQAKNYLAQAARIKKDAPEVNVNMGLIALKEGDVQAAEGYLAKGNGANTLDEALGNLYIAKGNYAQAEKAFAASKTNSAALAQILNRNYESAEKTLNSVEPADGTTNYLKAIVAARKNNQGAVTTNLKDAILKDASLAKRAAVDLEFAKWANNPAFQSLVK
jgi:tetratricopeptide (TPR) repeat protein